MAGLSAARHLKEEGFDAIVLEAQNRIGGRVCSTPIAGETDVFFEEGAAWIHGPDGNPITPLAEMSGAEPFFTDDENVAVFDTNGLQYTDETINGFEQEYKDILEQVRELGSPKKSFEAIMDQHFEHYKNDRLWQFYLSADLEFDLGGDIGKLSSLDFYDDQEFEGEDMMVHNGYHRLIDFVGDGLDIRLEEAVTKVDYNDGIVDVTTSKGTYQADFVVVAVPLAILKKGSIEFIPKLPKRKRLPIEGIEVGVVNKFLCIWEEPFWDTELQYIGYTPKTKGKFNYFLNMRTFSKTNGLVTFAFGDYAEKTEQMDDVSIVQAIVSHLKAIYGDKVSYPKQMLRTKWASQPFIGGSYSFASNGIRSKAFDDLGKSINKQLFFAGEHTTKDFRGTVHGAFISGARAADEILELLQPVV